MNFGERLRQIREDAGLSQRELQRRAELSSSYLYYVEKGRVKPGDDNVRKLAKALGVPIGHLIDEREGASFEEQGLDAQASIKLKKLGKLTEAEREQVLRELDRVAASRKRSKGAV